MKRSNLSVRGVPVVFLLVLLGLSGCDGREESSFSSGSLVTPQIALGNLEDFDTPSGATRAVTSSVLADSVYFRVVCYAGSISVDTYRSYADYRMLDGKAKLQSEAILVPEGDYKFVCYSYNDTTAIADGFDGSSLTIAGDQIENHDFLYSVFDKQLTIVSSLINITFKHLCSRVQVVFDSSQWGKMTAIGGDGKMTLTGHLSQITGMTFGEDTLAATIKANHSWKFDLPLKNALVNKSSYRYVGGISKPESFILSVPGFTFEGTDAEGNHFPVSTSDTWKVQLYEVRFVPGNTTYCTLVGGEERDPLAIPIEVVADGKTYLFGRGNLIYYKNPVDGKQYAMASEQGYYENTYSGTSGNEYMYFNWNTLNPSDYSSTNPGSYSLATDPCQQLGTKWVTPSKTLLTALTTLNNQGGLTYTLSDGTKIKGCYFGIKTQPDKSEQDLYLFLPATGYRSIGASSVNSTISRGVYWSSDGEGAEGDNADFNSGSCTMGRNDRGYGFAVRCVTEK